MTVDTPSGKGSSITTSNSYTRVAPAGTVPMSSAPSGESASDGIRVKGIPLPERWAGFQPERTAMALRSQVQEKFLKEKEVISIVDDKGVQVRPLFTLKGLPVRPLQVLTKEDTGIPKRTRNKQKTERTIKR